MESYRSGYGRVANSCGYGNEHAGSIHHKKREISYVEGLCAS